MGVGQHGLLLPQHALNRISSSVFVVCALNMMASLLLGNSLNYRQPVGLFPAHQYIAPALVVVILGEDSMTLAPLIFALQPPRQHPQTHGQFPQLFCKNNRTSAAVLPSIKSALQRHWQSSHGWSNEQLSGQSIESFVRHMIFCMICGCVESPTGCTR